MSGGIFLIQSTGDLVEMKEQVYDSEDMLQELLAKHPNLLAGDQMNAQAPRRWLLVSREMGIPGEEDGSDRWAVDHLFLDQDAIPTLVEVKRSGDTRIRREVVGQMLDYAANAVVYWPVEAVRARFEKNCEDRKVDSTVELQTFLGLSGNPDGFWQEVKTNLQAGRVRMVFVADEIPNELRRIVEFLNGQMDPAEVLAVEIKQFVGQGQRTLVPRVIGQTTEAERKKGVTREQKQWDEISFLEALTQEHGSQDADVARAIIDWAKKNGLRLCWGKGAVDGSFFPMLDHKQQQHTFVSVMTYGRLAILFQRMKEKPPFDEAVKRLELRDRLNRIVGVQILPEAIATRPQIPLATLTDHSSLAQFLMVLDWCLSVVRAS